VEPRKEERKKEDILLHRSKNLDVVHVFVISQRNASYLHIVSDISREFEPVNCLVKADLLFASFDPK
jgi:hypothetical protein